MPGTMSPDAEGRRAPATAAPGGESPLPVTGSRSMRRLVAALAPMTAMAPLAMNVDLPALPTIGALFGVDIQTIEAAVSLFLLGVAAGQIAGAPLSDRYGRRPVALAGAAIFVAATLAIAVSTSATAFVALRFVQAFGGGAAAVTTGAIVGDLFAAHQAARALNAIGVMVILAPALAPAIGAGLLEGFSWQAIYVFLLLYGLVVWLVVWRRLPETVSPASRSGRSLLRQTLDSFGKIARQTPALGYALCMSLAMGTLFVFLTDAAFVYMDRLGASSRLFAILSALNMVALILGNRVNRLLLKTIRPDRIIPFASGFQVLAVVALWCHVSFMAPRLVIVAPLVMAASGVLPCIIGNATASFLAWFPESRGAASGVTGTLPSLFGGLFGLALGVIHDGALATTAAVMAFSAVLGLLALIPARPVDQTALTPAGPPPTGAS